MMQPALRMWTGTDSGDEDAAAQDDSLKMLQHRMLHTGQDD